MLAAFVPEDAMQIPYVPQERTHNNNNNNNL